MFNSQQFPKVWLEPGSSQGESNGLYAAITENDSGWEGFDYLFDYADRLLARGGDLYGRYEQTRRSAERERQIREEMSRNPVQPGIMAQFERLNFWEKFAVIAGIGAIALAIARR